MGLIVYNLPACESRLNKKESQMLSIMVRTVCISIRKKHPSLDSCVSSGSTST